jgi:hypothetical protein
LLASPSGEQRDALLEACAPIGDPRLCPTLTSLAGGASAERSQAWGSYLAIRALAANGDSRSWETLCRIAADAPQAELRDAAAASLRTLTGYGAFAGQAWTLWWRDHAGQAARLMERDRLLADLHDPKRPIDRSELSVFPVDELLPLVDGALGNGAPWWPARAFEIMRADGAERWSEPLARRAAASPDPMTRLALILFIDQLEGPSSTTVLKALATELEAGAAAEEAQAQSERRSMADRGPERLALRIALERRR